MYPLQVCSRKLRSSVSMAYIDDLSKRYRRYIAHPWKANLAGAERTVFVVYDKTKERQLRARMGLFELATKECGHGWALCDITRSFGQWIASLEYRESYYESPEDLQFLLNSEFLEFLAHQIRQVLRSAGTTTAVGLLGVGSLYGFVHVSQLLQRIDHEISGRLVVFFPGTYARNNYQLLDARDGWNYLAVPVTMESPS